MGRDTATLLAGLVAAAALPALALGLGLPLWLSGLIGLGVFAGLWFLLRSGTATPPGYEALADERNETARDLIATGSDALARLKAVAARVQDAAMRSDIERLAATAGRVLGDVRADPGRAMAVRRMITFYLPNAVEVAEGWQTLERHAAPSIERVGQTRRTMRDLNAAFIQFAEAADAPELQELDTTLKVLNDSLKSDLETTS